MNEFNLSDPAFDQSCNDSGIVTNGLIINIDPSNPASFYQGQLIVNDLTQYKNTGSLNGTIAFTGSAGGSFISTAAGAYVKVNDAVKSMVANTSKSCLCAWIGGNWNTTGKYVGFESLSNTGNYRFAIVIQSTSVYLCVENGGLSYPKFTYPSTSNWYYVCLSYNAAWGTDNTRINGYLNGALQGLTTGGVVPASAIPSTSNLSSFMFGAITSGGTYEVKIGSVQLYNRSLSASEVLQNFNATKRKYGY